MESAGHHITDLKFYKKGPSHLREKLEFINPFSDLVIIVDELGNYFIV